MGVGTSMAWDVGTGTSMGIGHVCGYKVGAHDTGVGHGDGNGAWALARAWGTAWARAVPPQALQLLAGCCRDPGGAGGSASCPAFPRSPH